MSSLKSVTDAIVTVAEQSFFAYAEPVAGDVALPGDCYEIAVAFSGAFAGAVRIVMPIALARDLCAAFSGAPPDAEIAPEDVADLAGEFANMACGTWLTALGETECFSLAHPLVTTRSGDAAPAVAVMVINDQPISVALELES